MLLVFFCVQKSSYVQTVGFFFFPPLPRIMEGSRRCLDLVRGVQINQTGIRYPALIAQVTSRMLVSLQRVSNPSDVSEALTEPILSSGIDSLPEKALSHFHKSGSQFKTPSLCNHLLQLVFSPDLSTGSDFSVYKYFLFPSKKEQKKKISRDTTLEIKSTRIKYCGSNGCVLSCVLHN